MKLFKAKNIFLCFLLAALAGFSQVATTVAAKERSSCQEQTSAAEPASPHPEQNGERSDAQSCLNHCQSPIAMDLVSMPSVVDEGKPLLLPQELSFHSHKTGPPLRPPIFGSRS